MSSSQGRDQRQEEQPIIEGAANIVGDRNQAIAVPVTVNVSIHAIGVLAPHEHELLTTYRLMSEAGQRTVQRAAKRALTSRKPTTQSEAK